MELKYVVSTSLHERSLHITYAYFALNQLYTLPILPRQMEGGCSLFLGVFIYLLISGFSILIHMLTIHCMHNLCLVTWACNNVCSLKVSNLKQDKMLNKTSSYKSSFIGSYITESGWANPLMFNKVLSCYVQHSWLPATNYYVTFWVREMMDSF